VISEKASATVFRAVNGSPGNNLDRVLALMGGVRVIFGEDDVVILKPNLPMVQPGRAQHRRHGAVDHADHGPAGRLPG